MSTGGTTVSAAGSGSRGNSTPGVSALSRAQAIMSRGARDEGRGEAVAGGCSAAYRVFRACAREGRGMSRRMHPARGGGEEDGLVKVPARQLAPREHVGSGALAREEPDEGCRGHDPRPLEVERFRAVQSDKVYPCGKS